MSDSTGNKGDPAATTSVPPIEPLQPLAVPGLSSESTEALNTAPRLDSTSDEVQELNLTDGKPASIAEAATATQASQQNPSDAPSASASAGDHGELKAPVAAGEASPQNVKEENDSGPHLVITLLLITGSRHPFKIDAKYLKKQQVNVENLDPFAMSVYTLKELIWREWRQEWETRPSSPSSIRLISFGKLLDDKSPLSDCRFNRDAPNVVHMTVKPQEIVDEDDAKGAKAQYTRERESSERSPGCRCIIQ
ncbi:ubiquitin-like protein [Aspergillus japonicus CBS 114.51]|uniref:Ubiquitin-like protein n=2 Tax=Aspergillus TaxID=5052 RepID=A0A2V5H268_ASPV1|nr:ubiquitin-like protein [Aspergillus japonicus CBS 114.51]PYI18005.1 ubiquitin-like protein [Aspergillus violaceofuscus CBS 115571]RAH82263.1 ubiquitin-like protein [Aspergillus japonicus CBS 114.51]